MLVVPEPVRGGGGAGKSTIASAFAEEVQRTRTRWRHTDVWFVSATDPAALTGALVTVARQLAAATADVEAIGTGKTDAPDRLWRLLHTARHRLLLIFDNADDPSVLARPTPVVIGTRSSEGSAGTPADSTGWLRSTKRGLVVVTSRTGDPSCWGRHARIVQIGPLEDADATQVLLDIAPHAGDVSQAHSLARRLGGLPLVLRTAGSYLRSDSASVTSFRDYEVELDHPRKTPRMLTQAPELQTSATAREIPIRTFEISLDDLTRRGVPQARLLLRLLSCYASPTPIPRGLLRPQDLRGILGAVGEADMRHELEQGLQQLRHLSLVEFTRTENLGAGPRDVVLHPVIADVSRAHLRADDDPLTDAALIRRTSVDLLAGVIGQLDPEQPANWPAFIVHGPHVHALFQTVGDQIDDARLRDLTWVATRCAWAYYSYGFVAEARRLAQDALDKLPRLPDDDPASLRVQRHLAWFLVYLREPREAEPVYRKIAASCERALGPEDPDTLWTRHELAWIAACQERWAEAEAAYRKVLDVRRLLGDEHPDTLMSRHELAWTVANQGRGREAEHALVGIHAARRRVLGAEHPRTLWTRHELAWVAGIQGRWAEAESTYREVLEARRRLLRANHPDILTAMHELAWTIASQGRHDIALKLYHEVLDARRLLLGEDDPDTAATARAIDRLRHGESTVPRHLA